MALIPHFGTIADFGELNAETIASYRLALVAAPTANRPVTLARNRLSGPVMVYTPGTTYGARIAAMLGQHKIAIEEQPICESASAEALLAQVEAGLGAAWVPELLMRGKKVKRCDMPKFFDIPYEILLIGTKTPNLAGTP
jgi:DNA-binding transcriptional LysR family regulator